MIKKYISLLEIIPTIVDNITKVKDFTSNVGYLYNFLQCSATSHYGYHSQSSSCIKMPSDATIATRECALVFMGTYEQLNESLLDDSSAFCYDIPHILELEYLKQHNGVYTASETNMLYSTSVMLLLEYLLSLYPENNDIFHVIQNQVISGVLFEQHIYELDVDENPEQVTAIIDNIYTHYTPTEQVGVTYATTGIAKSTYDIHIAFNSVLSQAELDNATNTYYGIWKCLRYAPLYAIFTLLEKTHSNLTIEYRDYLRYCDVYDEYFAAHSTTTTYEFSNGCNVSRSRSYQDTSFLQCIMQIACETMKQHVSTPMIPCEQLLFKTNTSLLAMRPVNVLLSYSTLEW